MLAADVQHRAQRHSTERDVVTHVEQEAVEVLPQLHGLVGRGGAGQVVVRLMALLQTLCRLDNVIFRRLSCCACYSSASVLAALFQAPGG